MMIPLFPSAYKYCNTTFSIEVLNCGVRSPWEAPGYLSYDTYWVQQLSGFSAQNSHLWACRSFWRGATSTIQIFLEANSCHQQTDNGRQLNE